MLIFKIYKKKRNLKENLKKQIKKILKKAKEIRCQKKLYNFKTAFSMKASLPSKEPEILDEWEKERNI